MKIDKKNVLTFQLDQNQLDEIRKSILSEIEYDIKKVRRAVLKSVRDNYDELLKERFKYLEENGLNSEEYHIKRYCQGEDYAYLHSRELLNTAIKKAINEKIFE